ncbi:MAG: DUF1592 domain-containing protein, partial [Armatimonadota bacterium]|nr:DUF1592 domain-containing protein [Armatimonadota bacterium]
TPKPTPKSTKSTPKVAKATPANDAAPIRAFLDSRCLVCHDEDNKKGGLDLSALKLDLADPRAFATWAKVHDRVRDGEMPPNNSLPTEERTAFKNRLAATLIRAEAAQLSVDGRTVWRRLNRYEYENTLRDLLDAPWLQLKDMLPEDGEAYRFNKVGEALDVSHVQMARYLSAADYALRQVMATAPTQPAPITKRYYTREEWAFTNPFDLQPLVRRTFPVLGSAPDGEFAVPAEQKRAGVEKPATKAPNTVGDKDPQRREQEGVGVVLSTYEPTEIRWGRFKAPVAGRYKLRFMAHTIWIGPRQGKQWWVPDYTNISAGRRSEPITIYSDRPPRLLRKLGSFDAQPEAAAHEMEVWLQQGESIRPDAARFFRPRPGDMRNPWATPEGQSGVSFRWMEAEGPLYDSWPTSGHKLLFGDLPIQAATKGVTIASTEPKRDAERLLRTFLQRAYRHPVSDADVSRFLPVILKAMEAGHSFQESMIAGYTAVLCSPGFLYLEEKPGRLDSYALASRLSYFLWNSPPDDQLFALAASGQLRQPAVLRAQTDRLLDDPKSRRFVDAFLDYWLDLRKISANDADATLYPDYQLDDLLVESSVAETQAFFAELLKRDLSVKNLVTSDFAMVNERLATHYGLTDANVHGVTLQRVALPADSPRGGLLTQASVLKVTANGTTTSPVLRGVWILERILGETVPPPPASVPAVEPDTRGTTTIREQLDKHRTDPSCASCHRKIDPAGFALESFDVMGGWRERYRALAASEKVEDRRSKIEDSNGVLNPQSSSVRVPGVGHNGTNFTFCEGLAVDSGGQLPDGRAFKDVREIKQLLAQDDRRLARNLARQLLVYSTGAPIRFADRPKLEAILDHTRSGGYGTRQLIHEIIQSELFQTK